jgi:hypothetical protein
MVPTPDVSPLGTQALQPSNSLPLTLPSIMLFACNTDFGTAEDDTAQQDDTAAPDSAEEPVVYVPRLEISSPERGLMAESTAVLLEGTIEGLDLAVDTVEVGGSAIEVRADGHFGDELTGAVAFTPVDFPAQVTPELSEGLTTMLTELVESRLPDLIGIMFRFPLDMMEGYELEAPAVVSTGEGMFIVEGDLSPTEYRRGRSYSPYFLRLRQKVARLIPRRIAAAVTWPSVALSAS